MQTPTVMSYVKSILACVLAFVSGGIAAAVYFNFSEGLAQQA